MVAQSHDPSMQTNLTAELRALVEGAATCKARVGIREGNETSNGNDGRAPYGPSEGGRGSEVQIGGNEPRNSKGGMGWPLP